MDAKAFDEDRAESDQYQWQIERFAELGYKRHQSEILLLAHVDWHEAHRLLEHGCPHEATIAILT